MRLQASEWPGERKFPVTVPGATAYVSCSDASPVVHYPGGSWGPSEFSYVEIPNDGQLPIYVVEFAHDDGLPKVAALSLVRRGREVRTVDLRRLRSIEDIAEGAWTAMAGLPLTAVAKSEAEVEASLAAAFTAAAPALKRAMRGARRQGRRKLTPQVLAEVARVYREARPSGAPTKAVGEHFGVESAQASTYVKRARDAGEDMGD